MLMKKGKFTALFFVICLCAVQIFCLFKPQVEFSENENRNLQTFPELSLKTVFGGQFMKQFDSFTADQFLFRDHWVSLATRELLAIGKRDNQKTYFGKDGYLFAIDTIDNSQFSKNKELLREFLQKIKQEHPDIRSTVMVVPTSSAILTEKLPYGAPVPDEIPLIEEIGVSVDGLATFCNPVPELQAHTGEEIYYRTDHHWTSLGAYYAYTAWAKTQGIVPHDLQDYEIRTVSDSFLGTTYSKANLSSISPDSIQTFTLFHAPKPSMQVNTGKEIKYFDSLYDESYLSKKDQYSYFLSSNNPLVSIETGVKNGKTLLVLKDSFANAFLPFLTEEYERILVVDPRYQRSGILDMLQQETITDILVLYNIVNFANDTNLISLVR